MDPDLSLFEPVFVESARESWRNGDWTALHILLASGARGEFVRRNRDALLARGGYESMLFEAYVHGPHLHPKDWASLFHFADFTKPDDRWSKSTGPITVFRGIRHHRHRKWIRGLSWSTNPHTAAWFANRFREPDDEPAVYTLTVAPEHVFFLTNERGEEEAVIASWRCGRLRRLPMLPDPVKPE